MKIPKIIHQIWSGEPLPEYFAILGKTWKHDYPDWEYIQWDNKMMIDFVAEYYPQYMKKYESFPYNIQRWDAIRYLILDKMGGMYVDFDYESIEPMDELLADKTCCFAIEPELHRKAYNLEVGSLFNNAMMLCVPGHPFMRRIVEAVFEDDVQADIPVEKYRHVLMTTGPRRLMELYTELNPEERGSIYLIPAKYVAPFNQRQALKVRAGEVTDELNSCLKEAYAVHYYFSNWTTNFD